MARKAGASGPKPGLDRNRIGERLEASVAGLLELRLLRERQEETVRRVLQEERLEGGDDRKQILGDLQPPGGAGARQPPQPATGELERAPARDVKLELAGGREQCADGLAGRGSPTPLPEELGGEQWRGDAGGLSAEPGTSASPAPEHQGPAGRHDSVTQLVERGPDSGDTDSRPSSGFYDVTDSASCSLSTSCTSVYSEGPSSSLWSVQSGPQVSRPCGSRSRPRSTDDGAVRPEPGTRRALEGEGCVWGRVVRRGRTSQRPVSAGELTFLPRYCSSSRLSSSCPAASSSTSISLASSISPSSPGCGARPDPKFRCDLVSRHGSEVYHYPSPLHAVALQSPLFTASSGRPRELEGEGEGRGEGEAGTGLGAGTEPVPPASRERLDRYICGLVLRSRCGAGSEQPGPRRPPLASYPKSLSLSSVWGQGPAGVWKGARRRISTSCQASERPPSQDRRSPVTPEPAGLAAPEGPLYRGKHLHHGLVRCPAAGERDVPEHGGRRVDLFRRLGSRRRSPSRSSSEMNLSSALPRAPDASLGLECRPGPARRKQKWTSVLEIPAPGRAKRAGFLGQAQAFLSRRQRSSPCDSLPSSLGEEGAGWLRGAETLPRTSPVSETRFHRSRSFKELRKKVQLSIRPWSLKANSTPK
ncbi:dapper homolog 2-like [Mobula birostris]|uniref:dapper homolog 2-like n=1 Tax=Mobula birostris TaxID=1983395 RepID=UPI003B28D89A